MDVLPTANKPCAILEPDELRLYQQILAILGRQMELVQRAQAALEEAQVVAQAVDNERVRIWQGICDFHGLESTAIYTIDAVGRVFERTE